MSSLTEGAILDALRTVQEPELGGNEHERRKANPSVYGLHDPPTGHGRGIGKCGGRLRPQMLAN